MTDLSTSACADDTTACAIEPSDLAVAISVAQKMLAAYGDTSNFSEFGYAQAHGALSESLRSLLRALGAEPDAVKVNEQVTGSTVVADLRESKSTASEPQSRKAKETLADLRASSDSRCPAAHPEDPTPCSGPVTVTVVDARNAGADGCQHHAARLLASLDGGRVYALPDATPGTAIRVFKAADGIRPFPWLTDAPRTEPSQLSHTENRGGGQ